MKPLVEFSGYVFNLAEAQCLTEVGDWIAGITQAGSWFVYDQSDEEIVACLMANAPEWDIPDFAKALADCGFPELVVEHFPDHALGCLPEA